MTRGPLPKRPVPGRKATSHRPERTIIQIESVEGPPAPPVSLGKDGHEAWLRWWKSATWLAESDAPGLLIICQMLDVIEEMRVRIQQDGRMSTGSKGQPVTHPLTQSMHAVTSILAGWLNDYGLTPAGRRRLGIEIRDERPKPSRLERYVGHYDHLKVDA